MERNSSILKPIGDIETLSRRMLWRTISSLDKSSQLLAYIQIIFRGLNQPLRWMLKDNPLDNIDVFFEVSAYTPFLLNPRCFITSSYGKTPLTSEGTLLGLASSSNQIEIVKTLLKAGSRPILWFNETILSPASPLLESLRMQSSSQSWNILWKSISEDEKKRLRQGHPALQLMYQASQRASCEMVQVLLNEGIAPIDNMKLYALLEQKWPQVLIHYSHQCLSKKIVKGSKKSLKKARI